MNYVSLGATGLKVSRIDVSLSDGKCRFLEEPYRPHSVRGHS